MDIGGGLVSGHVGLRPRNVGLMPGWRPSFCFSTNLRFRFSAIDSANEVPFKPTSDGGHMHHHNPPRFVSKKPKKELKATKKTLKFVERLSRDLSIFSAMGFVVDSNMDLLPGEFKSKLLSEATQALLEHLRTIKEETEAKKKVQMRCHEVKFMDAGSHESYPDSSTSDSSDSDAEELVNMIHSKRASEDISDKKWEISVENSSSVAKVNKVEATLSSDPSTMDTSLPENQISKTSIIGSPGKMDGRIRSQASESNHIDQEAFMTRRIEVCMGAKCKKAGAMEILQEFEKKAKSTDVTVMGGSAWESASTDQMSASVVSYSKM